MAIKANGMFGKDIQLPVDSTVTKVIAGQAMQISADGKMSLADGTKPVVGFIQVTKDIAFEKNVHSYYGTEHNYISLETNNVTNLFVASGVSISAGDKLYVSSTEAGSITNVAPTFVAVDVANPTSAEISAHQEKIVNSFVGIALSNSTLKNSAADGNYTVVTASTRL